MTAGRTDLLDALAVLISYPRGDLGLHVRAGLTHLAAASPAAATELMSFADEIAGTSVPALQERYTETFDLDPGCTLDVGWHLFGDAPERGALMVALREDQERAGVSHTGELPDHLTSVLALMGRAEPARAAALAALAAPVIEAVHRALAGRGSPYAHLLAAVHAVVDGIGAEADQEVTRR